MLPVRSSSLLLVLLLVTAGCLQGGEPAPGTIQPTSAPEASRNESATPDPGTGSNTTETATGPNGSDQPDDAQTGGNATEHVPPPQSTTPAVPLDPTEVVVATFDTGTNPFHPCFRRPGADVTGAGIPGLPDNTTALDLTFAASYDASLEASREVLDRVDDGPLYHIPHTQLLYHGANGYLVDSTPHGSQASSQIVCDAYGMAPDAWLVITRSLTGGSQHASNLEWIAQQDWIDIVHLNIAEVGPTLLVWDYAEMVDRLVDAGKLVVVAAGNGLGNAGGSYPTELSMWSGPPGTLVAGANDNGGYAYYSNLDPHIVMDGMRTRAAAPYGFGETTFGGTSSASPRVTGYVAHLLGEARQAVGDHLSIPGEGLIALDEASARPDLGPLRDGVLTAAELHEVVRKTADPNPHESEHDGDPGLPPVYQPVDLPFSLYPKMGYGEVSEHTFEHALAVLLGLEPMPDRPYADTFYERSEQARSLWWEDVRGS